MSYFYPKLLIYEPTVLATLTNSLGQEIELVEHPTKGDEGFVIAICHDLKLAEDTPFFDLADMLAEHKEYEPSFVDGKLHIGGFLA
mgnify:CR=1 FL=1